MEEMFALFLVFYILLGLGFLCVAGFVIFLVCRFLLAASRWFERQNKILDYDERLKNYREED